MPFSISDAGDWVYYDIAVDGTHVLDGAGEYLVSGTFTVPDLGDASRDVNVQIRIWWSRKQRTVDRTLEYLGPALPADDPPAPARPAPTPDVAPQAASPAPASSPMALEGPSPAPSTTSPAIQRSLQKRRWGTSETRRAGHGDERSSGLRGGRDHGERHRATGHHKPKVHWTRLPRPRTGASVRAAGSGNGYSALSAIVPYASAVAVKHAGLGKGGGLDAAVMVPALLALAALMLATTAVLRRRRVASRSGLS